jgi:hypothetical protein
MSGGHVSVHYVVPFSGAGKLELTVNAPLGVTGADSSFILKVMELVNGFAEVVCPAAAKPEVPAVLRGVGGRP